jgi:hypothetical protein
VNFSLISLIFALPIYTICYIVIYYFCYQDANEYKAITTVKRKRLPISKTGREFNEPRTTVQI